MKKKYLSKQSLNTRHEERINLMQALFSHSFQNQPLEEITEHTEDVDEGIGLDQLVKMIPKIDEEIKKAAPERPLEQLNKVELAIIRTIMLESKIDTTPNAVLLNESVILAKEFGAENSFSFVNGALAKLLESRKY